MLAADEFDVRQRTRLSIVVWCPQKRTIGSISSCLRTRPEESADTSKGYHAGFGTLSHHPSFQLVEGVTWG
jgi:hypothetical protein